MIKVKPVAPNFLLIKEITEDASFDTIVEYFFEQLMPVRHILIIVSPLNEWNYLYDTIGV